LISMVAGGGDRSLGSLLFVLVVGTFLFRRFRNRGQREMRRFVKKVATLKEVRLVTFHKGQFTVVADGPTARTYLRLNALLATSNERLFHGDPMTLIVREGVGDEEERRILSSPGVQFVRDSGKRLPRLSSTGSGP